MRALKIILWTERVLIVWATVWFVYGLYNLIRGEILAGIIGVVVQGGLLLWVTKSGIPRTKRLIQIEQDRRHLDSLDW